MKCIIPTYISYCIILYTCHRKYYNNVSIIIHSDLSHDLNKICNMNSTLAFVQNRFLNAMIYYRFQVYTSTQ